MIIKSGFNIYVNLRKESNNKYASGVIKMGNFKFESNGARTFLVYCLDENEKLDTLSMGMFENNNIKGLITPSYYQVDTDRYLKYDVTSKESLEVFIQRPVRKKNYLTFVSGVVGAFASAERYMMPIESFCMNNKYIYLSMGTYETSLIYLPIEDYREDFKLKDFLRQITSQIRTDASEDATYIANIFNILNDYSITKLEDMKRKIDELNIPQATEKNRGPVGSVSRVAMNEEINKFKSPEAQVRSEEAVNDVIARREQAEREKINNNRNVINNQNPAQAYNGGVNNNASPFGGQKQNQEVAEEKKEGLFGTFLKSLKKDKDVQKPAKPAQEPQKPSSNYGFSIPGQKNTPPQSPMKNNAVPQPPMKNNAVPQPPMKNNAVPQPPMKNNGANNHSPFNFGNKGADKKGDSAGSPFNAPANPNANQPNAAHSPFTPPSAPNNNVMRETPPAPPKSTPYGGNNNFDYDVHTVVLENDSFETTIVIDDTKISKIEPRLVRKSTGETVKITNSFFKIGRSASDVDYTIAGNPYVGHFHAYISIENDRYFVVDNNSKNHTYVNGGAALTPNLKVEIRHGDVVTFSNEKFEFLVN